FSSTETEQMLAGALGLPLIEADPSLAYWGTKAGGRELFVDAGVRCPRGVPECRHPRDLAVKLAGLLVEAPVPGAPVRKVVVERNLGFSGKGNGLLDLSGVQVGGRPHDQLAAEIESLLPSTQFVGDFADWEAYAKRVTEIGAIAEEYLDFPRSSAPSAQ